MKGGEVEVVSELEVYELSMLRVLGVAEVVGGEEDAS